MKNVLLISPQPFFQWRGSPIRVGFNLLALTKLGYQVDLLTLPIGEERKIDGARIIRVANPLGIQNVPIGPSLSKVFFDLFLFCQGLFLCLKNRYNVVHGIEEAGFIAAILGRLIHAKVIYEKHSDPFSYNNGTIRNIILRVYAAVEKGSAKLADAVIGTGPGLVEQVRQMETNTPAFHIFDIPSSMAEATEKDIAQTRRLLIQNNGEVLVTFVGSFAVYQGVDLMFSAIPQVVRENRNVRFIIIGGNDDEIENRRSILEGQAVARNVTFLGKIPPDDLPKYLSASDILLSPRFSGVNTPLKVLDYMKAGRAIVATDIPSNRLLLDEKMALLAKPSPEEFAEAILSLSKDEKKRTLFGKALRKRHEKKYNFDEYCRRLSSCYTYVL